MTGGAELPIVTEAAGIDVRHHDTLRVDAHHLGVRPHLHGTLVQPAMERHAVGEIHVVRDRHRRRDQYHPATRLGQVLGRGDRRAAADPLPAAVGRKVIEILVRDRLEERARELGLYLEGILRDLQQRHEPIGDVRGRGLLLGMELVQDRHRKAPAFELGAEVGQRCIELGASLNIARAASVHIFRIAPPLTVTREQIDTAMAILDQALTECVNR